jgi:hypothetical protein
MRRLVGCVALVLAAACGGSSSGSGSVAPGNDAGAASPADAGAVAPPDDAGGTPPDADAGDAPPAADAGSTLPADAGTPAPDGGTTAACDGLAPAQPGPANGTWTQSGFQASCVATVNGSGILAFAMADDSTPKKLQTDFVSQDGTLRASLARAPFLMGRLDDFVGGDTVDGTLTGAPAIVSFDDRGNVVGTTPVDQIAWQSEDPLGGVMVLIRPEGAPVAVESFDERGARRFHADLSPRISAVGSFVVDRQGNTFLTADDAQSEGEKGVVAQWVTHDGVARPAFTLRPPQQEFNHLEGGAIARVGGGVIVGGNALGQLDSLGTQLSPAPAWFVKAMNDPVFGGVQLARNGRAYALVSIAPFGEAICANAVEIVAPDGQSCGKVAFPAGPGVCDWASVQIGYDGTLVQRVPPPADACVGGTCICTWHWWTGFFH